MWDLSPQGEITTGSFKCFEVSVWCMYACLLHTNLLHTNRACHPFLAPLHASRSCDTKHTQFVLVLDCLLTSWNKRQPVMSYGTMHTHAHTPAHAHSPNYSLTHTHSLKHSLTPMHTRTQKSNTRSHPCTLNHSLSQQLTHSLTHLALFAGCSSWGRDPVLSLGILPPNLQRGGYFNLLLRWEHVRWLYFNSRRQTTDRRQCTIFRWFVLIYSRILLGKSATVSWLQGSWPIEF